MTFVYDTRKVWFKNIAGEIVLPKNILVADDRQFARSPFVVDFQSGWLKFSLCTVHLYYGPASGEGYERHVAEIEQIAFLYKRDEFEIGGSKANSGVIDVFNTVFRPGDSETYYPLGKGNGKWPNTIEERKKYFLKEWRTWQMSDHLPLWIELKIDFTEKYLHRIESTV